ASGRSPEGCRRKAGSRSRVESRVEQRLDDCRWGSQGRLDHSEAIVELAAQTKKKPRGRFFPVVSLDQLDVSLETEPPAELQRSRSTGSKVLTRSSRRMSKTGAESL